MTKTREIYRCTVCGNVVEVVNPGAVLSCCGQPMKQMKENTTDGAKEKHVPGIEAIEGGYRVTYSKLGLSYPFHNPCRLQYSRAVTSLASVRKMASGFSPGFSSWRSTSVGVSNSIHWM